MSSSKPPASLWRKARWGLVVKGVVTSTTAVAVAAGMLHAPPARAAAPGPVKPAEPTGQRVTSVPVQAVRPAAEARARRAPQADRRPAPVWPAAGTAVVDLTAGRRTASAKAAGLPVTVAGPAAPSGRSAAADAASSGGVPRRVRIEVLDRRATEHAGVDGVLLRVQRADGGTGAASAAVTVDYGSFATAFGADWSSRLRLVSLPDCALRTPHVATCAGTPLPSRNDLASRTVTATSSVGVSAGLLAVSAAPSGPAGDYTASPLKPSSTWTAGGNTGAFTWSYPMRVPPALGGPTPQLALSYSSQAVDGQHAASNNQPSWVGEGFETSVGGFIERRYKSCAKDMNGSANNDKKTGDLCWETDNAVLSLAGHSGELIYNAGEKRWHLRNDDGSRIERRTGRVNGDNNGEYWVVTTTDGTQYWFGAHRLPGWTADDPETNSTWVAPVFGNDPGEECHAKAFADSDCAQAWRWNLDYVVDLSGNSVSYWYRKETNKYGRNMKAADAASYDRGGWLDRVDYGTRRINGADSVFRSPAPMQVDLQAADRCLAECEKHDAVHWPDVPWESACTGNSCKDDFSPTFWSTKRLGSVTTKVRNGDGYQNVERWTMTHGFPDPGDGTRAGLWLEKISHSGLVGEATSVPDIEFTPVQRPNRVDTVDFAAPMNWMRLTKIRNETGGTLSVTYSAEDCKAGTPMPAPQSNTRRCYPVVWTPEGYDKPVTDWFHKYVVTTIYENDNTGGTPPEGSPRVVYSYQYFDGVAWHYNDDDGLIAKNEKTWSDYRGYGRVGVTVGDQGEQTYTETRYFRGMHGDRAAPSGGTRDVHIDGIPDEDWYAGMTREAKVFNGGPNRPVVSRELSTPWASGPTASRTVNGDTVAARFSRVGTVTDHEVLDAGRGERVTKTVTTYDSLGMATAVDDLGQDGVDGDEQCTKTHYTPRNADAWLMDTVHRVQTYAVRCADTAKALTEADVIGETRTSYDGQEFQAVPDIGRPTRTEEMADWNGGSPTFTPTERNAYDVHGRVTSTWDASDKLTTMAYTPTSDGPVTSTLVTNPMQHQTKTTLDPAWGLPTTIVDPNGKRTDMEYDGLGRLTAVWEPGRAKATESPSKKFTYRMRTDAATVVSSARLNASGGYVESHELFDGLLRSRQTQNPSPSGGRLLTDNFYDSAGRPSVTFGTYHAAGAPGGALVTATDRFAVPNQTRTEYDGTGRTVATIFQPYAKERWRTATYHAGDRTDTTPPAGGTATSEVVDARGRVVEVRQYHGATPTPGRTGTWDTMTYRYDRKGHLSTVIDAVGNAWKYEYDIRGRQVVVDDPDKGRTRSTYDNAGRVASVTDSRGSTLAYLYDALGRKRTAYKDKLGGPLRAQWVYDTVEKGHLSQSTRFVGSAMYQMKVLEYSDRYQPVASQVVVPSTEAGLAGTYNLTNSYNVDGSLASTGYPSTNGDLAAETLTFGYNALGMPTTLGTLYGATTSSYVAGTDYNALGQIDQIELHTGAGGRVWQAFRRELETGRLVGLKTVRDSVAPYTLADVSYDFDHAGNVIRQADAAPDPGDDVQCYGYDHLRRLTEAWTPGSGDCRAPPTVAGLGGPAPYWQSWTFDAVGNRRKDIVHSSTGDALTEYRYPDAGKAQPHTLSSTTGARSAAYTYDEAGNTITRQTGSAGLQTLTWDVEGHLESAKDTTGETSYVYDADGNRLIRRDPAGKTLYLPGQEVRYNKSSGTTSCVRYYSHAGSVVATRSAGGVTWLGADHQGTAQIAVEAGSQKAVIRRQTPYGEQRGAASGWPTDRGFVGGVLDNTGLVHLGAREFDASIGRFISADPVMDLLDPQQVNGYAYSNNNPVTFSDPTGLKFEEETGAEYNKRLAEHRRKQDAAKKAERQKWLSSQINKRHNAAQEAAYRRIKKQVADMGGNADRVFKEYKIAGACKSHKACGKPGWADIVYIDDKTNTIYVWEVKSARNDGPKKASEEVKFYIRKLKEEGDFDRVEAGFALTSPVFAAVPGSRETVVAHNGPTPGSVLYRTFRWRQPKPPPPPREVPVPVEVPDPVKVPEPKPISPWVVIGVIGVVAVAGVCIAATAGACGVAIGAGAVGGSLATA